VTVWDVSTRRQIQHFDIPALPFGTHHQFALSTDRFAISVQHRISVGSLATGELVRWDTDRPDQVASMAFSPDGRQLFVCGGPLNAALPKLKTVYVYDTTTQKAGKPIETDGSVVSVVSGPGGTHAILQNDTEFQLFDLSRRSMRIRFPVVRPDHFVTARLRPTGGVTVGYKNGLLQRFDDAGRLEFSNRFPNNEFFLVTDVPDGTTRYLQHLGWGYPLRDIAPGRNPKVRVRGCTDETVQSPNLLRFGPTGRTLTVGYVKVMPSPSIGMHMTRDGYLTAEYHLDRPGVVNRKHLALVDRDFLASPDMSRLLHFNSGQTYVTTHATGRAEYDLETLLQGNFSSDSRHILGVNAAGEFVVIEAEFGRTLRKVRLGLKSHISDDPQHHHLWVNKNVYMQVRGDRAIFIVPPVPQHAQPNAKATVEERYTPGTLSIIDWRTCRLIAQYDCPELLPTEQYGWPPAFDISLDGRRLLHVVKNKICMRDLNTGQLIYQHTSTDDVAYSEIQFSPDGRTFAAAGVRESLGSDATVEVWDAIGFAPWKRFEGNQGGVTCLAFNPDSTLLASGGNDTTIIVWDVAGLPVGEVPEDREVAWKRLGEPDPAAAAGAARRLQRADGWSFLADRLKPDGHDLPSPDRIKRLVADLGAPAFTTREAARKELTKHIRLLRNDLKAARNTVTDPEQKSRLDGLIETARVLPPPEDMRRSLRVVQLLRGSTDPEAKKVLATLAAGHPDGWLTERAKR
jgi:WD40 repeat protein